MLSPPIARDIRRVLGVLIALVLSAGVAGCTGDDPRISPDRPARLVLRADDLPGPFTVFDSGPIQSRDNPAGPREDPERFGREDGWKARFRRAGGPETSGPFVVESRVDVFSDSGGADDELTAYGVQYDDLLAGGDVSGRRLDDPELGDGAVAFTLLQPSDFADVRFYTVAWRIDNAVGSLLVSGFEPKLALEDVVALARKQLARMTARDTEPS